MATASYLLVMGIALGVGSKVAAGWNTPQTQTTPLEGDPSKRPKPLRPRPPLNPTGFSPLPVPTPQEKSGSALHSIMEQGAIVIISGRHTLLK